MARWYSPRRVTAAPVGLRFKLGQVIASLPGSMYLVHPLDRQLARLGEGFPEGDRYNSATVGTGLSHGGVNSTSVHTSWFRCRDILEEVKKNSVDSSASAHREREDKPANE